MTKAQQERVRRHAALVALARPAQGEALYRAFSEAQDADAERLEALRCWRKPIDT
jgi:hypothetical protein